MSSDGKNKKKRIILTIIVVVFILLNIIQFIVQAITGAETCYERYTIDDDGSADTGATSISHSVNLRADGVYNASPDPIERDKIPPEEYGQWLKTEVFVSGASTKKFRVSGEVSLCLATLPKFNVQSDTNVKNIPSKPEINGQEITIPRVESGKFLELIVDATTNTKWRNVAKLDIGDRYMFVIRADRKDIKKDSSGIVTQDNAFTNQVIPADCSEGKRQYSPICGRFSIFGSDFRYVSDCMLRDTKQWCESSECKDKFDSKYYCKFCNDVCYEACACSLPWKNDDEVGRSCCDGNFFSKLACKAGAISKCAPLCSFNLVKRCKSGSRCLPELVAGPTPYKFSGTDNHVFEWSERMDFKSPDTEECKCGSSYNMNKNFSSLAEAEKSCASASDIENYNKRVKYWFSADNAAGLMYKFSGEEVGLESIGSDYIAAKIIEQGDSKISGTSVPYKPLLTGESMGQRYLQARLYATDGGTNRSTGGYSTNTGGYVLGISQTACIHKDGQGSIGGSDDGTVQYRIEKAGIDPNLTEMLESEQQRAENTKMLNVDKNGEVTLKFEKEQSGYMWLRIKNGKKMFGDRNYAYIQSDGTYRVEIFEVKKNPSVFGNIIEPLIKSLKEKTIEVAVSSMKTMTCYKTDPSKCISLFNYIRGMLIIYIAVYGLMVFMGVAELNQKDIVIRLIKISLVAGLIDGRTFEFFQKYVLPFVVNFSDSVIANMSGYELLTKDSNVTFAVPFLFVDEVFTKVFSSLLFSVQVSSLLAIGFQGIFYFILVIASIKMAVIAGIRMIAVYIMSFMFIAILISVAPIFLTFILFGITKNLFDNWVKFMFRYMMEPIILTAGIVILMQLYTIYLDFVLGYSVCTGCAMPLKLPFISDIEGVPAFLRGPIFCFDWYVPWGFDRGGSSDSLFSISMQYVISLVIIAYCMEDYVDISSRVTMRLIGGTVSAANAGKSMIEGVKSNFKSRLGTRKVEESKDISKRISDRIKNMNKGAKNARAEEKEKKKEKDQAEKDNKKNYNKENGNQENANIEQEAGAGDPLPGAGDDAAGARNADAQSDAGNAGAQVNHGDNDAGNDAGNNAGGAGNPDGQGGGGNQAIAQDNVQDRAQDDGGNNNPPANN